MWHESKEPMQLEVGVGVVLRLLHSFSLAHTDFGYRIVNGRHLHSAEETDKKIYNDTTTQEKHIL